VMMGWCDVVLDDPEDTNFFEDFVSRLCIH
jgi:hypothetical protein